jgi:hypothetical protein
MPNITLFFPPEDLAAARALAAGRFRSLSAQYAYRICRDAMNRERRAKRAALRAAGVEGSALPLPDDTSPAAAAAPGAPENNASETPP